MTTYTNGLHSIGMHQQKSITVAAGDTQIFVFDRYTSNDTTIHCVPSGTVRVSASISDPKSTAPVFFYLKPKDSDGVSLVDGSNYISVEFADAILSPITMLKFEVVTASCLVEVLQ